MTPQPEKRSDEAEAGICGDLSPTFGTPYRSVCALPAEHKGWHRAAATYNLGIGFIEPLQWSRGGSGVQS